MKLTTRELTVQREGATLKIQVRAHEGKGGMIGFLSLAVYKGETFIKAFNDFSIFSNESGINLREPQRQYTTKDGETKYANIYVQSKTMKDDIVSILKENFK